MAGLQKKMQLKKTAMTDLQMNFFDTHNLIFQKTDETQQNSRPHYIIVRQMQEMSHGVLRVDSTKAWSTDTLGSPLAGTV